MLILLGQVIRRNCTTFEFIVLTQYSGRIYHYAKLDGDIKNIIIYFIYIPQLITLFRKNDKNKIQLLLQLMLF